MIEGSVLIATERQRQIREEKYLPAMDDVYVCNELLSAANCYTAMAMAQYQGVTPESNVPEEWPWDPVIWKPSPNPMRNLAKAGALIAAEIDRLHREKAR